MRAASDELKALLATRRFVSADLFTFLLVDGTVLRHTDGDHSIVADGETYTPLPIARSSMSWRCGVDVDTTDLTLFPRATDLIGDYSWQRAANLGQLDAMRCIVRRGFASSWSYPETTVLGSVHLFEGRLAGCVCGASSGLRLSINSDLELLNQKLPKNLYQPGCIHTLFSSSGCTLDRADWTFDGYVASGTTTSTVLVSGISGSDGYYDQGVLLLDDGLTRRSVKKWLAAGSVTLAVPLHQIPEVGAGISLIPGCDKTKETCSEKFANIDNFRAFPFVPAPEASLPI